MLEITTLGNFKVIYNDVDLTEEISKSDMVSKLMIYLALHHDSKVEAEKIASDIWRDSDIENPAGALKNLTYRLRTIFRKNFPDEEEVINTSRGCYFWNPKLEIVTDIDLFNQFIKNGKSTKDAEEKCRNYESAVDLFRGDFLPKFSNDTWIDVLKTYYHNTYLLLVKWLCELYIEDKRFEDMGLLCNAALEIDKLEEQIYYYQILAMVKSNNLQMGLRVYENAKRILKKELGVDDFPKLKEAYEHLLRMDNGSCRTDIKTVKVELSEEKAPGPFFCGFAIFKEIYQLSARKKDRSESNATLLLLSVDFPYDPTNSKMEHFAADKTMKALQDVLSKALRKGDVVSKYADFQYIVMIGDCEMEYAGVVVQRINENFENNYPQYMDIRIRCDIASVEMDM